MIEAVEDKQEYISTGISGLDAILYGGFLRAGFYLLQGNPGSGKTTLSLQFLFSCVRQGERGLYISLTESRTDLLRTCRSHGWDLNAIDIADLTRSDANLKSENQYSVFHPSEIELGQTIRAIFAEVERTQPRHVVFDGLSEMRLLAERPLRYRHQMLALKAYFEDRGITVLLLDDQTSPLGDIQPESLVGGNIIMERYLPGYGGQDAGSTSRRYAAPFSAMATTTMKFSTAVCSFIPGLWPPNIMGTLRVRCYRAALTTWIG